MINSDLVIYYFSKLHLVVFLIWILATFTGLSGRKSINWYACVINPFVPLNPLIDDYEIGKEFRRRVLVTTAFIGFSSASVTHKFHKRIVESENLIHALAKIVESDKSSNEFHLEALQESLDSFCKKGEAEFCRERSEDLKIK